METRPPRRVLMLAYEFPPSAGGGVQRLVKFARYLPEAGWEPTVIAAEPVAGRPRDDSLVDQVRDVPVVRLPARHVSSAIARVTGALRGLRPRASRTDSAAPRDAGSPSSRRTAPWSVRLARWVSVDDAAPWSRTAVRRALAMHREQPFDVVLASGPPYSAMIAAVNIAEACGIPAVVDLRDPWRDNAAVPRPTRWHRRRAEALSWLDFVVTGKARSNIRHVLKGKQHEDSVEMGRRLLNKALSSIGSHLDKVPQKNIDNLVESTKYTHFDYILEDIGIGNRVAYLTARQLVPEDGVTENGDTEKQTPQQKPLVITGDEGMTINYANCCHPLPGDSIIGHMSAGRGIVVHASNCIYTKKIRSNPSTAIELSWADSVKGEFIVPIAVDIKHQRGMVAILATKINSLDANIESINIIDKDAHSSRVDIELSVHDRVHLARIMRHIRNIKSVSSITRVKAGSNKRTVH